MMRVVAAQVIDVQRHEGMIDETLEKLMGQIDVEFADPGAAEFDIEGKPRPAGEIDHDTRQRLVQRHVGMTVAADALLVADGLGQRLAEGNADILDRMMRVDMQVAFRLDLQIHHAVARDLVQHVVEEGHAGSQLGLACAVEVEANRDLGFERISGDFGLPHWSTVELRAELTPPEENSNHDTILRFLFVSWTAFGRAAMSRRYWSAVVRSLTPYVPGEQPKLPNLIKLNTNENPYGPSPRALEALRNDVAASLRLYPDPNADRLKQAIAGYHGIAPRQVFVGNGSDEVLAHVFMALLKHDDPILFPDITYSFYPVYCRLYGVEHVTVPLADDFEICIDDYLRQNGGIVFPNPNAPTGRLLPLSEIERLLAGNPDSAVVIDEAYVDFGGESAIALVDRYPNLLVVQTLSKSRSLAGLRVGFAVGHADLIEALERVKGSFNSYPLDRLAIAGAVAAIEDREHFETTRQTVIRTREKLVSDLEGLGFVVLPSAANFLFVRHPSRDAAEVSLALRQRSIIVRHFKQPRIEQFLRITVGTDEQCAALVTALHAILG